jgi:hypothetical protein
MQCTAAAMPLLNRAARPSLTPAGARRSANSLLAPRARRLVLAVACRAAVVGIDLGTATSAIALIKDGQPAILQDSQGTAIIPSVVAYTQAGARG